MSTDPRLDTLMSVLVTLHEIEVITDPAVSSEPTDNGTMVTVEFLLDYDRASVSTENPEETSDE